MKKKVARRPNQTGQSAAVPAGALTLCATRWLACHSTPCGKVSSRVLLKRSRNHSHATTLGGALTAGNGHGAQVLFDRLHSWHGGTQAFALEQVRAGEALQSRTTLESTSQRRYCSAAGRRAAERRRAGPRRTLQFCRSLRSDISERRRQPGKSASGYGCRRDRQRCHDFSGRWLRGRAGDIAHPHFSRILE